MKGSVPPALLRKYDRPGPRYTSYPTVPVWSGSFSGADHARELSRLAAEGGRAVSLYVHLPFCRRRCRYCGCNAVASSDGAALDAYLDRMEVEMELLSALLAGRVRVVQMHWGGGTPNHLGSSRLQRLMDALRRAFHFDPAAELSLEADPRAGGPEQPAFLRELGFRRISLGVQDLDPRVQEAIGRIQPEKTTRAFFRACRKAGFHSVNVDLVYGLPAQTPDTFRRTLDKMLDLAPDRVACFGYAHVPWIRTNQRAVDARLLPAPEVKFSLFRDAVERFTGSGYAWIGLDHFARPEDELARAAAARRLHRNFMGYTPRPELPVIALGASGISDLGGSFAQNEARLDPYAEALNAGRLPVVRGIRLTPEDRLRRRAILHLMCNLELPLDPAAFGGAEAEPGGTMDLEIDRFHAFEADGLVRFEGDRIRVTERGRFFVRNLCMVLDAYLGKGSDRPLFSRTV